MSIPILDFDVNPKDEQGVLNLVRTAYDIAVEHQGVRDEQCERNYQGFHAFVDMDNRDPDRANVAVPKLNSAVRLKHSKIIRAVIGRCPYIPLDAKRKEYREQVKLHETMLDKLLQDGCFYNQASLCDIMAILNGTAFLEAIPYYEKRIEKTVVPEMMLGMGGMPQIVGHHIEEREAWRLQLQITPYAIWEVKVDPFATGLEKPGQCRYVIKIQLMSKRELKKMATKGAYGPNFDVDKLDATEADYTEVTKHRGLEILQNMGIPDPRADGDIGVLFRYESEERYIDIWNDRIVVRDEVNPYIEVPGTQPRRRGHGLINLSRIIHGVDPHTQTRFWGCGEAKIAEILFDLLNDNLNLTMDNANHMNQGMTYALKTGAMSKEQLVHAAGNKVLFDPIPGSTLGIRDYVWESFGGNLPRDFYALREVFNEYIDLALNNQPVMQGKQETGDKTLGEVAMLREAGDTILEQNVKDVERPFLADFASKCLGHIEQFAKPDDIVDMIGEEDAAKLLFLHPQDVPGGFDYLLKGSETIVNQLIKQRHIVGLSPLITESPYLKRRNWDQELLDTHDIESDEMLYTEEEMAQMQQQQAQEESEKKVFEQGVSTEGKIRENRERFPLNEPAGMAQRTGQEAGMY